MTETDGLTGIALRYGGFYGPGTGLGRDGDMLELVRGRKLPIVGAGQGVWSLVHILDAARATALAVDHGSAGVYNVVDDGPAPVAEWLPALAEADRGEGPAPGPRLARPAADRPPRRHDDDRDARVLEREGEARAGLAAGVPHVARRVPVTWADRRIGPEGKVTDQSLSPLGATGPGGLGCLG